MGDPTQNGSTPDLVIIRAQRRVIGHVTIDGTRYAVRSPPGSTYARIQQIYTPGRRITIEETWEAVGSLLPDLPPEILHELALEELRDIVDYALDPVRTVEKRAATEIERLSPKDLGTEMREPSSPRTGSDTSATESPPPPVAVTGTS